MNPRIVIVSEDLVAPSTRDQEVRLLIGRALSTDHPVRIINVDRSGAVFGNGARPSGAARRRRDPRHAVHAHVHPAPRCATRSRRFFPK
jgi:hypothetical protein